MTKNKLQKNIPEGWALKKLSDVLDYERPDNYIVKSTSYANDRKTPVLTANKSFILGYTNEDFGIYEKVPCVIFDDFTTDSKYVDFPFKIKSSAIKILQCKDEDTILKFVHERMKLIKFPLGNHKRYYISQYQDIEILLPKSKDEQQKIAEILGTVDDDIAKTQDVIKATEKIKKGLMQKLFTCGIGHTKFKKTKLGEIPEEWNDLTMRDICLVRQGLQIPISERFKEKGDKRYLYLTIKYLRDAHLPNVAEYIENPSKSVVCKHEDILMTRTGNTGKVITNVEGVFHNNFFLVDYDKEKVDKNFLVHYLNSYLIQKMIKVRAGSTTIPDLNHGDFYSLPLPLPKKEEQLKIADIFSALDEKISISKKLKAKLIKLKKGLMDDLLSGGVRVNE